MGVTDFSFVLAGLLALGVLSAPAQAGSLRDGEKLLPKITVKQLRDRKSGKLPARRPYLILREERYRTIEVPAQPVAAAPAPESDPVAEAPPDPASPRPVAVARGAETAAPGYEIGQPLPADTPQVTLNWRAYGLPEPPAGQVYARVRGEILLLDAADRLVIGRADLPQE